MIVSMGIPSPLVLFPDQIKGDADIGGKASALCALQASSFRVPPWFVITPVAFYASLSDAARLRWSDNIEYAAVQEILQSLAPPPSLSRTVAEALLRLGDGNDRFAVRSSALGEDGAEHSFAGQLESVLFVPAAQVISRVLQVWRSGFSERIYTYRRENRLRLPPPPPAVIVQRMVNADVAGVAFGADPVSGRRGVRVIGAVLGLGSALVSGEADADTYYVDRAGSVTQRTIATKTLSHVMDETAVEGVKCVRVDPARAVQPALTDDEAKTVASLVEQANQFFAIPQDIEWARESGKFYLLQSRPITSIRNLPDPDAQLTVWDNSNIAESYRGITKPLTFSFARRSYEAVYREFCKLMRVPAAAVAQADDTFGRMLGHIQGRVYYNLVSWYRVLAMLPGFRINRPFMEQMMGLKQAMPAEVIARIAPPVSGMTRVRDAIRLSSTLIGLVVNHFAIQKTIAAFYRRLNVALADARVPLTTMRSDELADYYRDLERQLLKRWDAPLVNDFFAMIHYGVLRKLATNWCNDGAGTLQNDLMVGEGNIVSAEPAKRIKEMAKLAMGNEPLVALLVSAEPNEVDRALQSDPELAAHYRNYLAKFGDRCLDELKLESASLFDDPLPLLRSVGHMAKRLQSHPELLNAEKGDQRERALAEVNKTFRRQPVRKALFMWVLKHARARVSERENLRFERTRVFGRVRSIFIEIGKRLYELGQLTDPRDIFYLTVEEVLGFIEGTAVYVNLKEVVALRKVQFDAYAAGDPPADRFETRGLVYHAQDYRAQTATVTLNENAITGIGCCAGIVRGPVRVVREPRGAELKQGEILVAERTDPGWIMLFPAAAGLLVEHGSLLSHSAIVAREMGIPAVIGLSGVTAWLRDGDLVEMDGRSGTVRRVELKATGHD